MDINGRISHTINGPVGSINGQVSGDIKGDVLGDIYGQVNGDIHGDVKGSIYGTVNGNVNGLVYGKIAGIVSGKCRSAHNDNRATNPQIGLINIMNSWKLMQPKISTQNKYSFYSNSNQHYYSFGSNGNFVSKDESPTAHQFESKSNSESENKSPIDCPICFKNLNEIKQSNGQLVSSQCGHIMCNSCFDKVFQNKSAINCPFCGLEQLKSNYHKLFL
ncbi:E3 ubiquitin- ligase RNF4-like isoform X1 [Brachionus plicatilis]|uniref:E3 ubiquitin-ligase RNF4-like isoform X1 n=1 Tax=Brachionus plicatilis TaxID=10195 RepID=A0A3M7RUM1_BRAPC|nr:E3 ubiquitin- ligase RNF4-like isoform X1 [Brachionus plicatilis]